MNEISAGNLESVRKQRGKPIVAGIATKADYKAFLKGGKKRNRKRVSNGKAQKIK